MRHIGRRGTSPRTGVLGATLVAIVLFGLMLAPGLASAIVGTSTVKAAPAPVNTVAPSLTGTPALGQTLTCSTGTWANNPTSFSYAWLRSGVPIAGQAGNKYVVQAADEGHTVSCQVTAGDGGGDYTISGLPSGTYRVGFYLYTDEGANYLEQFYNGKTLFAEANAVTVSAPNATGGVNAELHAGGQIAGRVTSAATHGALSEIEVCADTIGEEFFGNCAKTNANGEYTIIGLATGRYEVEFFSISEGGGYISQVYNGKSLYTEATSVSVTAPNTTAGIDAELLPASEGGKIAGVVTGPADGPLTQSVEVCAYEIDGSGYGCTSTGAGGAYTVSNLPSGEYGVEFYAGFEAGNYVTQYYQDKASYEEATPESVLEGGTTTLMNVEMQIGGQITGKVTAASGGAALENVEACANEVGASEEFGSCGRTNSKGEYTISTLPTGKYLVEFTVGDSENYVDQSYNGGAQVSVTQGLQTTGINSALQTGGVISGKVTDASSHAGITGVEVCADEGEFGRCASTTASGEYAILGLSGTYNVEFFPDSETLNYLPQTDDGVSVGIGGSTSGINAELHPGGQITGTVTDAATHAGVTKIEVCADEVGGNFENCAETTAGSASATAASNALTIPSGNFTQAKPPSFDSKTDDIDFFFTFPTAGTLKWSLFFKNADVGFADSLGISLGAGEPALAQTARHKGKAKKCKKNQIKHHGRCVAALVSFASGSQGVPAGTVEVKVHADSKALKALKAGRTLHVSGTFTFQSALGGPPVAHSVSTVVHLSKKAAKGKGRGKGKGHGRK
jgi:hypothetical protein